MKNFLLQEKTKELSSKWEVCSSFVIVWLFVLVFIVFRLLGCVWIMQMYGDVLFIMNNTSKKTIQHEDEMMRKLREILKKKIGKFDNSKTRTRRKSIESDGDE